MADDVAPRLADGSPVRVVPIRDQDRTQLRRDLVEGFALLSDESRYTRFLSPVNRLSEGQLRRLVDSVDDRDHVALVLQSADDATPIGLGRFLRDPRTPSSAEVAVTILDAWQGKGAGRTLTRALVEEARRRGVERFTATVSAGNPAAIAMLRSAGRSSRTTPCGPTVEMTIDL